ncbi:MAG: glycine cleavage system protein GcvH [Spirochaetales bacterium]|nr:glycine cleavage system protein GcvH [Spirochaetales bacterium]
MKIPGDLRYTKEHLWLKEEAGVVICGITDHAQELLDEISCIELPEPGKEVARDEVIATIESLKSVFDVLAPVNGKIAEVNDALKDNPSLMNTAPYEDGWIVRLEAVTSEEYSKLMTAKQYTEFVDSE